MNIAFKILVPLTLIILSLNLAYADTYQKYDSCEGSFVTGGFSSERKTFVVTASEETGVVVIHINGTTDDKFFDVNFKSNGGHRVYSGEERFGDHTASVNINCATADDKFCPAELVTNLSGSDQTFKLKCSLDRIDYPSPTNPGQCTPHHCR